MKLQLDLRISSYFQTYTSSYKLIYDLLKMVHSTSLDLNNLSREFSFENTDYSTVQSPWHMKWRYLVEWDNILILFKRLAAFLSLYLGNGT